MPEQLMGVKNELLQHLPPEPDQDRQFVIYYCPSSNLALWRLPNSALKDLPNLANLGAGTLI